MDAFSIFLTAMVAMTIALMVFAIYLLIPEKRLAGRKAVSRRVSARQISVISRIEGAKKCSICMGVIKKDLKSVECPCGCSFHGSCGARIGICPACQREIVVPAEIAKSARVENVGPIRSMPLSKEDRLFLLEDRLLLGDIDHDSYAKLKSEILTNMPEPIFCAACGKKLYPGEKCNCIDEELMRCPECGREIGSGDRFCRACGLVLREDFSEELFQCSSCGRIVSESERVCTCGALLLDPGDAVCPECGTPVSRAEKSCPKCGRIRIIELLECPSCGREVSPSDFECECGAIFEDMIARIECPECGAEVGLEDRYCRGCGIQFEKNAYSSLLKLA